MSEQRREKRKAEVELLCEEDDGFSAFLHVPEIPSDLDEKPKDQLEMKRISRRTMQAAESEYRRERMRSKQRPSELSNKEMFRNDMRKMFLSWHPSESMMEYFATKLRIRYFRRHFLET